MGETNHHRVRLYFAPQSFPCGPDSACCGPVGQSAEEVASLVTAIEAGVPGVSVETVDVSKPLRMDRDAPVFRLLNAFGLQACPMFGFDGEVISMGPPAVDELVALIRSKLTGAAGW